MILVSFFSENKVFSEEFSETNKNMAKYEQSMSMLINMEHKIWLHGVKLFDLVEIDILKNNLHLIVCEYWLSFEKLLLFIELLY